MIELMRGIDGNEYKVLNGTWFNAETPDWLCEVLEALRQNGKRVRVFYAYRNEEKAEGKTFPAGVAWTDEFDVTGRIGRSCGSIRIPLLINTRRSLGGSSLLDSCIGCIMSTDGCTWYRMVGFKFPEWRIVKKVLDSKTVYSLEYRTERMEDFQTHAVSDSEDYVRRLHDFMTGRRFGMGGR